MRPEPRRTASRAETSRPSAPAVTRTAAGETRCASAARTSTFGVTRKPMAASPSATYTFAAPCEASASFAFAAEPVGPTTTAEGSPSTRAAVSSSSVTFLTSPSTWSTRTSTSAISLFLLETVSDELLADQVLGDLRAAVALVLDLLARGARRLRGRLEHTRPGVAEADLARVDTQVGDGERLDRLLLRGHDALERRVARLVDLLADAHQRGQLRLEVRDAVLGLAGRLDRGALDGQLADIGHLRQAEQLGDDRRDGATASVRGLVARDDQVVAAGLRDGGGEDLRGRDRVRAVKHRVGDVDRLVGAHGQRLADGVGRAIRAYRDHGDLALAGFLDLQRLFDGLLVDLVEHGVGGSAVARVVGAGALPLRVRGRYRLDQAYALPHGSASTSRSRPAS